MKRRVKVTHNPNDHKIYKPQFRFMGLWFGYNEVFYLGDDWFLGTASMFRAMTFCNTNKLIEFMDVCTHKQDTKHYTKSFTDMAELIEFNNRENKKEEE